MRLAVLCSPKSWYLSDLRRAAGGKHALLDVAFGHLAARCHGERPQVMAGAERLNSFDALLVRTMPPGSLEQVVFRMDALAGLQDSGVVVINRPRAIETSVDKYLATAKLIAAGLPSPRTVACQTIEEALESFDGLGGDVVVKPLFGGEGRGIIRLSDRELAERAFRTLAQLRSVIYLQEFVPHEGFDVRLLVIGERVLGMRRTNRGDWRTNVSRGARTAPFPVDRDLRLLALAAAKAVGATLAGVDVLPGRDGKLYVLEVNAVPGWQALARTLKQDIASLVLEHVEFLVRNAGADRQASGKRTHRMTRTT